jgi:MOSC domain-containing protein YiiM
MSARLVSIQVGVPQDYGDPHASGPNERAWRTAFYKSPRAGPVNVRRENLDGDAQADRASHGGPDKAVCVYSADHFPYWQAALAKFGIAADSLSPGAFGENFTVAGLVEADVCIGDVWRVGDASDGRDQSGATFQISQPRQPCWKLARRWGVKTLAAQVIETGKTGWYFRVLAEGVVSAGMQLMLVERPCPDWTVERANRVMHHEKRDRHAAARLAAVEWLSASWRAELSRRANA